MTDFSTATYADGPQLAAWLRSQPLCSTAGRESARHRIADWAGGNRARLETVDEVLTELGFHLSEVPDHIWRSGKLPNRSRYGSKVEANDAEVGGTEPPPSAPAAADLGAEPTLFELPERRWVDAA